jgi:hypothetical protein
MNPNKALCFTRKNEGNSTDRTSIPATFLCVTVAA